MKTNLWAGPASTSPAPAGDPHRRARTGRAATYLPVARLMGAGVLLTAGGGVALLTGVGTGSGLAALGAGAATLVATAASAVAVRRRVGRPFRQLEELVAAVADAAPRSRAWGSCAPRPGPAGLVEAMTALVASLHRSQAILAAEAASPDLSVVVDGAGLILHASAAADSMLGRPSLWMAGRSLGALVHPDDRVRLDDLRLRSLERGVRSFEEVRVSHLHGHWVVTEITVVDIAGTDDRDRRMLHIRDVSDRKAHEEALVRQALYDPLTGLANRALFREHVDKALARLRRTPARPHAVLFVDLDGFKTINDSLGHAAGDEVLAEVGLRLQRWMRPGDTAARLGGDEFAVLLENTSQIDTGLLAKRILHVLLAPILVQGKEVVLTGSIGIALSELGQDSEALLRNADAAMYTAKAAGKGQYRVFEPEMHHAAMRRLDLEADLRRAIARDEVFLAYQPIVDLASNRVAGTEVLVRWQHPERGLIPPLDFISVAEDSGYIRELGRFILEQACFQAKEWHGRFPDAEPLRLCVNTSVRQIEQDEFFGEVERALRDSGLDGRFLTLEITESLFMSDLTATVHKLRRLKELGLTLAVDDFGTGYSSLSYLRRLPIDILKIDKSFVVGVTQGPEHSAVARAVVKLARTFNLATVAEGVERPEQAAELLAIGAEMGQGYWFSRPLPAPAMQEYLERSRLLRTKPTAPATPSVNAG